MTIACSLLGYCSLATSVTYQESPCILYVGQLPRKPLLGRWVNKGRAWGLLLWCRGEAVASHHFPERCGVGRAASCGLDDSGHLAEVLRAEDAGADDREHLGVNLMIVVEAVDDSARDAQHLTRADIGLFPVERPAQHALKPVDRLHVTVMAVGGRHSGCGWYVELEDCHRTSRVLALEQESDRCLPDPDFFACAHRYEYPFPSQLLL